MSELQLLNRAHELFAGRVDVPASPTPTGRHGGSPESVYGPAGGVAGQRYRVAAAAGRDTLLAADRADAGFARVVSEAFRDHALARVQTGGVVAEARTDTAAADTPLAQRELMRRRAARLRAQHRHVVSARRRARRRRKALRALRYRAARRRIRLPAPNSRAGIAVRAALSRLGRPYVWGATGPTAFDCSGLTQWSYAQAGVRLDRTTYQQISDGISVPRSQVRPGDLVFPNPGHVQLAIGNNLVVEAPHAGAAVRIAPLGTDVQIRRPPG